VNLDHVVNKRFPPNEQVYTWKDSALYALALGFTSDPMDESELRYVYEQGSQLAVPTQCVVLGWPGIWHRNPQTGIDWVRQLHAEQRFEIHKPLETSDAIRTHHRIHSVEDKGAGRGAILNLDTVMEDMRSGEKIASLRSVQFLRGDGGCGNYATPPEKSHPITASVPDRTVDYVTLPQAALLYRLNGDDMPLHADPKVARRAGFDRPIMQGLGNMGIACRAVLKHNLPERPQDVVSMFVRFTAPSYPGETIRLQFFEEPGRVRFRAWALERKVLILDRGDCVFRSTSLTYPDPAPESPAADD
jgi:acyl dehydratase